MLMRAVDRGVHADCPVELTGSVSIGQELSMNPVPGAIAAESTVPLPHCLPRPELSRQIPPRRTRPEPPHDALNHTAMILERTTTLTRGDRHQRLNPSPCNIRKTTTTRHTYQHAATTQHQLGNTP